MNIAFSIVLGLFAGLLAWLYGKSRYNQGFQDGIELARQILDKHIAELKEKGNGEKDLH